MKKKAAKPAARKPKAGSSRGLTLLVATRKGAWLFHGDAARKNWRVDGPHFLGHIVSHLVLDPRDGRTLLAATKTGHLGPTMFRSTDLGRTWQEVDAAAGLRQSAGGREGPRGRSHLLADAGACATNPVSGIAGTSPQGLFRSGRWRRRRGSRSRSSTTTRTYREWMGTVQDGTPDGPKLHSIIIDPRDAKHMYFGMSGGGVHEIEGRRQDLESHHRRHGSGAGLQPRSEEPDLSRSALRAHVPEQSGPSVSAEPLRHLPPRRRRRLGCASAAACRRRWATSVFRWWCIRATTRRLWVLPMDGTTVWPRTSPGGKPAVYTTRNAGKTWQRLDAGLPKEQAWWTVKRQAMCGDAQRSGRALFRHHQRRAVDEPRRRPQVDLHRAPSAGDLCGRNGGVCVGRHVKMKVLIPSALLSYTASSTVEAAGATVAEVLADLEARYPGIRFRMIDEQDAIRRHIRIFVNGEQVPDIAHPLDATDEIVIVQALSGG